MKDSSGKWNNITGATASTFIPTDAQAGQDIRIQLSYTDLQGTNESIESTAVTVANVNDLPTGAVAIAGTAQEDSTLTADTSAIADADGLPSSSTFTYQWQVSDGTGGWKNIAGATNNTFVPGDAEAGQDVRVQLSYTDQQGTAESLDSSAVTVANVNDNPTGGISISGEAKEGEVLSVDLSSLADNDGLPATYSYQWQISDGSGKWSNITGATNSTFTPDNAQSGKTIRVQLSYTDLQGTDESVTSTTVTVNNINDEPTGAITITGTPQEDSTLSINTSALGDADGLPDSSAYRYQWQMEDSSGNWKNIDGATAATFIPGDAEAGQEVRVQLSYTDQNGTDESVISTAVTVANLNDAPTGSVTITGTIQEDATLTADTSKLADADGLPATYSYQWQVGNGSGGWNNITGATNNTFTPGDAQAGQEVRVQLSYTDLQSTAESVNSAGVTVANVNDSPTGSISIAGTAQEDSELSVDTSTLSDNDGLPASSTYSYQWQMKDSSGK